MVVCLYVRLSLDRNGTGAGVERQEAECRAYAAARGWEVGKVYVDNDLSATSGRRRPAFEELLADAPEAVLVWHTDRLVRVSRDLERVLVLDLTVYSVTAGTLDLSLPSGRAIARTLTAWATYEGEHKAERQRAEAYQRAQDGRPNWARRPFGFEMDASLRQAEADAIREAYTDTLRGVSRHEIARRWNAAGLRGPLNGKPWTSTGVRLILRSPRNAGLREYRGEIVGESSWPAIVDRQTWDGVQALLNTFKAQRAGRGREVLSLLSGIATCAGCGAPIAGGYRTAAGVLTYRCTGKGCVTNVPRDKADAWVWGEIVFNVLPNNPGAWPGHSEHSARRDEINAELAVVRDRLTSGAQAYADGLLTLEQLAAVSARLRKRQEDLQAELGELGAGFDIRAMLADDEESVGLYLSGLSGPLPDSYTPTLTQRREMVRQLLSVRMFPRGKGTRTPYDPARSLEVVSTAVSTGQTA